MQKPAKTSTHPQLSKLVRKLDSTHKNIQINSINYFFNEKPINISNIPLSSSELEDFFTQTCNLLLNKSWVNKNPIILLKCIEGITLWAIRGWIDHTTVITKFQRFLNSIESNELDFSLKKSHCEIYVSTIIDCINRIWLETIELQLFLEKKESTQCENKKNNSKNISIEFCKDEPNEIDFLQIQSLSKHNPLIDIAVSNSRYWPVIFRIIETHLCTSCDSEIKDYNTHLSISIKNEKNVLNYLNLYKCVYQVCFLDPTILGSVKKNAIDSLARIFSHFESLIFFLSKEISTNTSIQVLLLLYSFISELNKSVTADFVSFNILESKTDYNITSENHLQNPHINLDYNYIYWICTMKLLTDRAYNTLIFWIFSERKTNLSYSESLNNLYILEIQPLSNHEIIYIQKFEANCWENLYSILSILLNQISRYQEGYAFIDKNNFVAIDKNIILTIECLLITLNKLEKCLGSHCNPSHEKYLAIACTFIIISVYLSEEVLSTHQKLLLDLLGEIQKKWDYNQLSIILAPICWYPLVKFSMNGNDMNLKNMALELLHNLERLNIPTQSPDSLKKLLCEMDNFLVNRLNLGFSNIFAKQISKYLNFLITATSINSSTNDTKNISFLYPEFYEFLVGLIFFYEKLGLNNVYPSCEVVFCELIKNFIITCKVKQDDNLLSICTFIRVLEFLKQTNLKKIVLLEVLPSLASRSDALATMELVKIANKLEQRNDHLLAGCKIQNMRSQILAITFLSKVVINNPKVWIDFASIVDRYFGFAFSNDDNSSSGFEFFEINVSIISAFVQLLESDGEQFSGKIIPLLYHKIERISDSGIKKNGWLFLSIIMKAVLACGIHGGMNLEEIWLALGLHSHLTKLVSEFISEKNLNDNAKVHYNSLLAFIEFFLHIPKFSSDAFGIENDPKYELYTRILSDFILPLVFHFLEKSNSQMLDSLSFRIMCLCFDAISNYPSDLWLDHLAQKYTFNSIVDLVYNQNICLESEVDYNLAAYGCSKFFAVLMDKEAELMRRSVYRGAFEKTLNENDEIEFFSDSFRTNLAINNGKDESQRLISSVQDNHIFESAGLTNRIAYLGKIFKTGNANVYGNTSMLTMIYLLQKGEKKNLESLLTFNAFKQNLMIALNDISLYSDVYPIAETTIDVFKKYIQDQNQPNNALEIFKFLICNLNSKNSSAQIITNSIYALGGLVKYVNSFNPGLSSSFSEQCMKALNSLNDVKLIESKDNISYWEKLATGFLNLKDYFDDRILAASISSSLEWCISTPADYKNQLNLFKFITERIKYSFHQEIISQNKHSLLASVNGVIRFIDFFDKQYSSSQNSLVFSDIKKLGLIINQLPIFENQAFTIFGDIELNNNNKPKHQDFVKIVTDLNFCTFLQTIVQIVCTIVKLQLKFLPHNVISERQKIIESYLSQINESTEYFTLLQIIEIFAYSTYLCVSYICMLESNLCLFNDIFARIINAIDLIENSLEKIEKNRNTLYILNTGIILKNYLTAPLSGLISVARTANKKFANSNDFSENNKSTLSQNQYLDQKYWEYKNIFLSNLNLIKVDKNNEYFSSKLPPKLISEKTSFALVGISILSGLVPYSYGQLGFKNNTNYEFYTIRKNLHIESILKETIDKLIGTSSLNNENLDELVLGNFDNNIFCSSCWLLITSYLYEKSYNAYYIEKKEIGDTDTSTQYSIPQPVEPKLQLNQQKLLSNLTNFGSSDPINLSRLVYNSICRKIWEKLLDAQQHSDGKKISNNQIVLWMSLLLMKWPFPLVNGIKKLVFHIENGPSLVYRIVVFLVASRWSSSMYSSAKAIVLTLISTLNNIILENNLNKNIENVLFAEHIFAECGLGKILTFGGLQSSKESNPKNYTSHYKELQESSIVCGKLCNSRQFSVLYKIANYTNINLNHLIIHNNHICFCRKQKKLFGSQSENIIKHKNSANLTTSNVKLTSAQRMEKQLSTVTIPSSIVENIISQISLTIKTHYNSHSLKNILQVMFETLDNHYYENKRLLKLVDNVDKEENDDVNINDYKQVENPLLPTLINLKVELTTIVGVLFSNVYNLRINQMILNNALSSNFDLKLVCSYIDATNANFSMLSEYPKNFNQNYKKILLQNETSIDIKENVEYKYLNNLIESITFNKLILYAQKSIYYEGVDLSIQYQVSLSESQKIIGELLKVETLIFDSTNELTQQGLFGEKILFCLQNNIFIKMLRFSMRIRSNAICMTTPFTLLLNSKKENIQSLEESELPAINKIKFTHMAKVLMTVSKTLDIIVLNTAKLAKRAAELDAHDSKKLNKNNNLTNDSDTILNIQKEVECMINILIVDFVGLLLLNYFKAYKNLNKPVNHFNEENLFENSATSIAKLALNNLHIERDLNDENFDKISDYSLINVITSLETSKLDIKFVLNMLIPICLTHYLETCYRYQKAKHPEYYFANKILRTKNIEKQAESICNRINAIYQNLLFIKMSCAQKLLQDLNILITTLEESISLYYKLRIIVRM
ncbi:hypothetical protein BB561_000657 [Smittium simulii]|uniref:Uncharacterized protein n=1 Tax=Smittium simulii TaxID=133385 RepID=A0A2T9YY90_9FUNG|nr:hypothetical protein BB561_000657 [Smittium simulii]